MTKNTKYAIAVYPDRVEVFTFEDKNTNPDWCKNDTAIQKAMKGLKEPQPLKDINLEDYIVKNQDGTLSLSLIKKGIYLENGEYNIAGKLSSIYNLIKSYIKNGRFTVKFKEWDTDFYCGCTKLISLEGCPDYVKGSFDCDNCKNLLSLKGAPKEVGRSFYCDSCNNLTSLEGAPKKVGRNFTCEYCNNLTSLEGAPEYVGKDFYCGNCKKLTSLEGAPKKIGGKLYSPDCPKLEKT